MSETKPVNEASPQDFGSDAAPRAAPNPVQYDPLALASGLPAPAARVAPRAVLVTGATGFIGSSLVARLVAAGHRVRILCRETSSFDALEESVPGQYERVLGDLTDPESLSAACRGVAWVFHLAGLVLAWDRPTYRLVNAWGTGRLFAAAQRTAADTLERFVYVSSQAALGPADGRGGGALGRPLGEHEAPRPVDAYGESKLAGERQLRRLAGGDASRWPWTIARPPAVYGPRDTGILPFFQLVDRGLRPDLGRPAMRLSLVHAWDLVEGLYRLGWHDRAPGEIFHLANAEPATFPEVMRLIQRAVGRRRCLTLPIPLALLRAYGRLCDGLHATLMPKTNFPLNYEKTLELSARHWVLAVDKAQRELGYRTQIPLADGLRETARWYRHRGDLPKRQQSKSS